MCSKAFGNRVSHQWSISKSQPWRRQRIVFFFFSCHGSKAFMKSLHLLPQQPVKLAIGRTEIRFNWLAESGPVTGRNLTTLTEGSKDLRVLKRCCAASSHQVAAELKIVKTIFRHDLKKCCHNHIEQFSVYLYLFSLYCC